MKKRHADVIKAWADGAEIEISVDNKNWTDCLAPYFQDNNFYRVKSNAIKAERGHIVATDDAPGDLFVLLMTGPDELKLFEYNPRIKTISYWNRAYDEVIIRGAEYPVKINGAVINFIKKHGE